MSLTLRTDVFSYQPIPKQIPKFDTNQLIDLEEKIASLFIMKVQKQSTLPYKKQEVINKIFKTISIKDSPKRFEVSRRTLYKWRCTPRKIVNEIVRKKHIKYPLEFKQRAVSMVCLDPCINQISKRLNISYNTLNNWMKKAFAPNLPYNSTAAWLYIKKGSPKQVVII